MECNFFMEKSDIIMEELSWMIAIEHGGYFMNKDYMTSFLISPDSTVVEAMQKIDSNARGILFITDKQQKLLGVATDGDIRRWIIKTGNLQEQISCLMNSDPKSVYRREAASAQDVMKRYSITALPVLNAKGVVIDILFEQEHKVEVKKGNHSLKKVSVVIMAGGKGTRLYPYTKILPKPLIPIGDIPIMERIINKFRDFGVTDFYATVNYRKNMIKSYFTDAAKDYEIKYVDENQPLGTAGSLRLIENDFEQPFIVTNCDILIHADYEDVYQYHKESGNELTIVTALKNIIVPYGVIRSSENGAVQSMEEKPKLSYFVNTGMYILNPNLKNEIPQDTFYHMTDLTVKLLKENRKVGMYPISEDSFLDMGEFEEMHRMEKKLDLKSE